MSHEASTVHDDQSVEELRRELAAKREQQAATSEILRIIGESRTDIQAVFDTIITSAVRLCGARMGAVFRFDGELVHFAAQHNYPPRAIENLRRMYPRRPQADQASGRAILARSVAQIEDLLADQFYHREQALAGDWRSVLAVPMLREGVPIGAIVIARSEVGSFPDGHIELLKTFANHAVIAIENTRLFEEVQARTNELTEALEQQTATSELLKVIGRSAVDLQPVFEALAESAVRLCKAERSLIWRPEDDRLRLAASYNATAELIAFMERNPPPLLRSSASGRASLERRTIHIEDVLADPEYTYGSTQVDRVRTVLAIPMLKGDELLGVIVIYRHEVLPFTTSQIALMKTFADQAVIAIENTRLFEEVQARTKELQDSLDRQTATSEVLGVISRSPNEVQPILDTIVATAQRLCQAERAAIWRLEGETFRVVAHHGQPDELLESVLSVRVPLSRGNMVGRATLARRAVQVEDVATDPELVATSRALNRAHNIHTVLAAPLLLKGEPIGVIRLSRTRIAPFDDKQVALVESFADQAVIAIENARLFEAEQASKRELTESLEQQTATADVLKVISRSALDVQKVLDALVESAARLCDAYDAAILQVVGHSLRLVAHHGQIPTTGPVGQNTSPLVRGGIGAHAVFDRRAIHVADMLAEADEYPRSRKNALQQGWRTALAVPLVHAGEAIGVIFIRRAEVRPFTERQVELVNTFADQAVIAIENTRLFEEVQARTRELAKTVEDLEIASQHKNQFVANMSHELRTPLAAILGYAELIQEGFYEPQGPKSLDALTRICSNGKHLLGLINTVLDIAKIESGQFTLNMTEYAIESVVETVRAATESLAQNKKLTLTTSVEKSLPIGLGDEQRLTQVLLNLVGNAIKFTNIGEVRVRAKAVDGHFNISVTDTGPGIPEQEQVRIFEQFHQVDSSLTKAAGGTGLGLAIAKQIVEMHGGRIWVESTLGKGSTFQMQLPTRAEFRRSGL